MQVHYKTDGVLCMVELKCEICGNEQTSSLGKNMYVCEKCAEPSLSLLPNVSLNSIIKAITTQYGEEILLDSKLSSLISDVFQNKSPNALRRIRLAIGEGIPKSIYDLKDVEEQGQTIQLAAIASTLIDGYSMEENVAYEIINCFANALGFSLLQVSSTTGNLQSASVLQKEVAEGEIIRFDNYYWQVLDVESDKVLILSDKVICNRKYHHSITSATWATCEIRNYLNGEFFDTLGTQEKLSIIETIITTNNNPSYGTYGGNVSKDKVFLLSIEEALQYLGDNSQLSNLTNQSAYIDDSSNSSRVSVSSDNKPTSWWLRSPGNNIYSSDNKSNSYVARVCANGIIDVYGYFSGYELGVRPAMWLWR